MADGLYDIHVEILFPSNREAQIAYYSLRVDVEPKNSHLQKNLSCDGCLLIAEFLAPGARVLRVAVNSFMERLILCIETMEKFGPPLSQEYTHF